MQYLPLAAALIGLAAFLVVGVVLAMVRGMFKDPDHGD